MTTPPTLPGVHVIMGNLTEWQQYTQDLTELVDKVTQWEEDKMVQTTAEKNAIRSMLDLFSRAKVPTSKAFDPTKVIIEDYDDRLRRHEYSYNHDGVRMKYLGRVTCIRGDYDYFIDQSVSLDGSLLLKERI